MHRIDTDGNKEGKFYDGDPSGTDIDNATVLDAPWLNAVQEEICTFIESKNIKLEKGNYNQLGKAIVNAFMENVNPTIKALRHTIVRLGYDERPDDKGKTTELPELIK